MRHSFQSRATAARLHTAVVTLAALATLGFPGCPETLTRPGESDPNALTMSNCWPNDDGRYWWYDGTGRALVSDPFTFLPEGVTPRAVTVDDARRLLRDEVATSGVPFATGYGLMFQGEITTMPGVTAQYLAEGFPRAPSRAIAGTAGFGPRFLARLAAARPDLRGRIARVAPAALDGGPDAGGLLLFPYFIHGYAWRKSPAWIGTYGDLDTLLAWKFLDSDVRPGHRFDHQLVPSLADDIWLHAVVDRKVGADLPDGGHVANAIEVIYLIDYGITNGLDNQGNFVGIYRAFDYGRVTYAPGVGPLHDLERKAAMAGETLTHGEWELSLSLGATGAPPPPGSPLAAARR